MRNLTHEGGAVYLLTAPSGKRYIGQSWNLEKRMAYYRRGACSGQPAIQAAIAKHGWGAFTVAVVAQGFQSQGALDAAEDAFIIMLDTLTPGGYNLRRGGAHGKHSAETCAKISARQRGVPIGPFSKSHRDALSAAARGVPKSPEHRAALSLAQRGRKRSPKLVAKTAAAHRGRKRSAETRRKMRAAQQSRRARERAG